MKICLVTDAWAPQMNGVVRTLFRTREELAALGHAVSVVSPDQFFSLACPTYPEIRLALFAGRKVAARLAALAPDAVHISTEGPLGIAARRYCLAQGLPFTTAYHTRFPEYVAARFAVPPGWTYAWLRRFHAAAWSVMVATASIEADLQGRGFANIRRWSRGVDTQLFRPGDKAFLDLPRPIHLYVGRVAVEKNIEAFLALDLDGSKVVVGDGPQLAELRRKYPAVRFLGAKTGEELAHHYAAADVFVFPSRTDTFRLGGAGGTRLRPPGRRLSGRRAERHPGRRPCRRARPRPQGRDRTGPGGTARGLPGLGRTLYLARGHGTVPRQSGADSPLASATCAGV